MKILKAAFNGVFARTAWAVLGVLALALLPTCSSLKEAAEKRAMQNNPAERQQSQAQQAQTQGKGTNVELKDENGRAVSVDPKSGVERKNLDINPKTVVISRKGKTYEIKLNVNPGDENMQIKMDIPDDEEQKNAETAEPPKTKVEHKKSETSGEERPKPKVKREPVKEEQEASTEDVVEPEPQQENAGEQTPPVAGEKRREKRKAKPAIEKPPAEKPTDMVEGEPETPEEQQQKQEKRTAVVNSSSKRLFAAQQYFYHKQYDLALDEVDRAIAETPDFAYAYALKGSIYYKLEMTDMAVGAWKKALEIDPNMTDVRKKLTEMGR